MTPQPYQTVKKDPAVCSVAIGVTMAMTISISIVVALALLPIPNHAFAPVRTHGSNVETSSMQMRTQIKPETDKVVAGRKFALSARDTIFSLGDDDDDCDDHQQHQDDKQRDNNDIDITDLISAANDSSGNSNAEESKKKKIGDPLREDNGVRPSIHPTAINAIVDALKARAIQSIKGGEGEDDDDVMHFRVTETVEPLTVMLTAGQFASDAIQKRQESSEADGMLMNQGEEQTVAGRIMGVIMRLDMLEEELAERVSSVEWIGKYDEWGSFGVLSDEHQNNLARGDDDDDDGLAAVHAKILEDPLFCMNRAECLLAIFLRQVEIPQLEKLSDTVPDGSKIDFLDQDRLEVVVGSAS
uniref:Uncharacterized protein n=1 Tax=Pseudo-nitzschia australis TaxID=44445 RepID=A0A6U9ZM97_9STRA|mmetsp:Transcript_23494/g.51429  ORF Transcript_23494/g.51429 Transcript_23494/m.51429 type:complete len:357 (+) Transcript_23494:236-1306(+)